MSAENPTVETPFFPEIYRDAPPEVKLKIILKLRPELKNEIKKEIQDLVKINLVQIRESVPLISAQAAMTLCLWVLKDSGYFDMESLAYDSGMEFPELVGQINLVTVAFMLICKGIYQKIEKTISRFAHGSK